MKEPILSREQVLKIVRKTLKENNDRDKLSSDRFVALAAALESAILEKLCGEPVAFVCAASNPFAPIIRDKAAAQKLSDEHWNGEIVPLYALNRSKA